jgi:hypothetical protein
MPAKERVKKSLTLLEGAQSQAAAGTAPEPGSGKRNCRNGGIGAPSLFTNCAGP